MIEPSCKTCKWWEPFSGVCCNGDSEHRADFTDRNDSCECWERHLHERCGGTLEAREYNGVIEHYCYGCLFTVLINGKSIEETRGMAEMNETVIENAKITHTDLSMADCGILCFWLTLEGAGWGTNYGGYVIGKGFLGAKTFEGSAKGTEVIMRIMDTVGVERWNDLEGKYVRVYTNGWGAAITKIGNIISDKWFDIKEFFSEGSPETEE